MATGARQLVALYPVMKSGQEMGLGEESSRLSPLTLFLPASSPKTCFQLMTKYSTAGAHGGHSTFKRKQSSPAATE